MVTRVSSKKIHMIAITTPEGVRSSCGINGLPFDTAGDMSEIVLAIVDKILRHVGDPAEVSATGEYAAFLQELEQYR